jgi:succinate dehydrogenase / fumarate reductase cytochrome b subunit
MVTLKNLFSSTLGRKYIMGASGLALGLFVIVHLIENLTLYAPNGDMINNWAAQLEGLGFLLKLLEWGLFGAIIIHIITAIQVTWTSKGARRIGYAVSKSKGGPSKSTVGSRNMIVTGLVLATFLGIHLYQFRFGPGVEQGYTTTVNGVMVHDLYRIVVETFSKIQWVIFYSGCMLFLGFHLRHGYWSAFQSLGLMNPRISKPIYALGLVLALMMAVGFFMIPIYIHMVHGGGMIS